MKFKILSMVGCVSIVMLLSCASNKLQPPKFQKITISEGDSVVEFRMTENSIEPNPDYQYFWFKQQKIYSTIGAYSGNLLDQEFSVYTIEGDLQERGYFKNGLKTKIWSRWKGDRVIRQEYVNGQKNGLYQELVNGIVRCEGKYSDGLKNGKFTTYDEDTSYVEVYKDGSRVMEEEMEDEQPKEKRVRDKKENNEE